MMKSTFYHNDDTYWTIETSNHDYLVKKWWGSDCEQELISVTQFSPEELHELYHTFTVLEAHKEGDDNF